MSRKAKCCDAVSVSLYLFIELTHFLLIMKLWRRRRFTTMMIQEGEVKKWKAAQGAPNCSQNTPSSAQKAPSSSQKGRASEKQEGGAAPSGRSKLFRDADFEVFAQDSSNLENLSIPVTVSKLATFVLMKSF